MEEFNLDEFHWHEAIHTTHLAREFIWDNIVNHPTYIDIDESYKHDLSNALDILANYYEHCCNKQDLIKKEKTND